MAGPSRHALIIEDEMVIGLAMQAVLTDLGFDSFAFASTEMQALEQARLRRPDLVTADVNLLAGDGLEVGRTLEAEFGVLPILYVTGMAEEAARSGRKVVAKPFTAAEIAAAYAELTDGRDAGRPADA